MWGSLLSTLAQRWDSKQNTDTVENEVRAKILLENLYVWLSAWEHKAETPKSSNILKPYLQVQSAQSVTASRERRPGCVCVYVCVRCVEDK